MKPKITVIVLNWNGYRDTLLCVESLKKIKTPNFEILVVDNGSTDNSEKILKKKLSGVKIIQTGNNLGFAGGNNIGLREAIHDGAEYILILNNDTIVDRKCVIKMTEAFSDHKVGAVQATIYRLDDKNKIWASGFLIDWSGKSIQEILFQRPNRSNSKPYEVDWVNGAALMVKKEVINKTGPIPEKYFMVFEDVDWSIQIKRTGYKLVVAPEAIVYHRVSGSLGEGGVKGAYYSSRNFLYFIDKYAPLRTRLFMHFRSLGFIAKWKLNPAKNEMIKYRLSGLIDFYLGRTGPMKEV